MSSRKLRFAIFGNLYQPKKSVSIQNLLACLAARQADVYIEREFYNFLTTGRKLPIEGVRVFETKTNYMLCELSQATAPKLKDYLIHEHGILIRDCSNFYGLSKHFFRVSAQLPEENDALVEAIRMFLERKNENNLQE